MVYRAGKGGGAFHSGPFQVNTPVRFPDSLPNSHIKAGKSPLCSSAAFAVPCSHPLWGCWNRKAGRQILRVFSSWARAETVHVQIRCCPSAPTALFRAGPVRSLTTPPVRVVRGLSGPPPSLHLPSLAPYPTSAPDRIPIAADDNAAFVLDDQDEDGADGGLFRSGCRPGSNDDLTEDERGRTMLEKAVLGGGYENATSSYSPENSTPTPPALMSDTRLSRDAGLPQGYEGGLRTAILRLLNASANGRTRLGSSGYLRP
ncbi:hypothetical protein DFH06DRAFT_115711 [Mycena polygramma]|nr:hypothetical protein DFH06DRAFT_115711 [Mycena polygramma]